MRYAISPVVKFLKCAKDTYAKVFGIGIDELINQVNRGNPDAYYVVAEMYEVGTRHATQDLVSAYCWYCESLKRGMSKAEEKIRLLESKMTPEQLSEAKKYILK